MGDASAAAKLLWDASTRGDAKTVGEILQSLDTTGARVSRPGTTTTTPTNARCGDLGTASMSDVVDAYAQTKMCDGKQAGLTALFRASENNHINVVELLVTKGNADVNKARSDTGSTPLFVASENGHINVVEFLVTKGNADVNKAKSDDGTTPLYVASQNGHINVVEFLVTKGNADVNKARSDIGATPLYVASEKGHINVVELLVTKGNADVNKARSYTGSTPLYVASQNGHINVVELLVTKGNTDVNKARSDTGSTPLFVASQNGHINVVELLVTKGNADVNKARSDIGATPLYVASQNGHINVVEFLVTKGNADVNKARSNGSTPLAIAGSRSQKSVVDLLVCCGAAPPQKFQSSLEGNTSPLVKALLSISTTAVNAGLLGGITTDPPLFGDGETPLPRKSTCCLCLVQSGEIPTTVKDAVNAEIHQSITDHLRRQQQTPRILSKLNSICEVRDQVMKRPSKRFSALSFAFQILGAWLEVAKKHCQGAKETAQRDSAGTIIAATKLTDTQTKVTTLENQMKDFDNQATQELKRAMGSARSCAQIIWWLDKEKDAIKRGLGMAQTQLNKLTQVASTQTLQALSAEEVANLLIPELHLFMPSYHQPSCANSGNDVAEGKEREDELRQKLLSNNVNGEALEQLTNEDMVDLGLTNLLHRKAIFHVVESVKVFGIIPPLWNCNNNHTALSWTEDQVGEWLAKEGFGQLLKETTLPGTSKSRFLMPGWAFVHLTHGDLKSLGLTAIGDLRRLSTKISILKSECFRKGTDPNCNNGAPNDGTASTSKTASQDPNGHIERALKQPEVRDIPTATRELLSTQEQNPKEMVLQAISRVTWEQLNENLHEIVNSNGASVLAAAEVTPPLCAIAQIVPNASSKPAICCTSTSSSCDSLEGFLLSTAKKTTTAISCIDENVMSVPQCDSIYSGMEKKDLHCPSNNIILLNQALGIVSKLAEEQFPSFIHSLSSALKSLRNVSEGGKSVECAKTQVEETKKLHGAAVEELKLLKNALLESEEKLRQSVVQSRAHREFLTWLCLERADIQRELDSARRDHETINSLFAKKNFAGLTTAEVAGLVIPEINLFSWSHESNPGSDAKEQEICKLFMKNMMDGEALNHLPDDKAVLSQLGIRELLPRKALRHFIRHHVIGSASASTPTATATATTTTAPPVSAESSPVAADKTDCGTQQQGTAVIEWTPQQVEKWFKEQIEALVPRSHNPGESASPAPKATSATATTSTPESHQQGTAVPPSATSNNSVGETMVPPGWAFVELEARDIMDLFPTLPIGIVCKLAHRITLLVASSAP
ncbi:TKL protein kinase [Pelomyxa schiedti]|nr:TKL protein kinase [Pelomyxa schiedti]